MKLAVKECFLTLQGEGAHAGRAAVLCRFAGCNLWSGREQDRPTSVCSVCDTDFVGTNGPGGGFFHSPEQLAAHVRATFGDRAGRGPRPDYVVFTGGEPLLQLTSQVVLACHALGLEVGVETNGTVPAPDGLDWLCVSPKRLDRMVLRAGNELKLLYPLEGLDPRDFEGFAFDHFFLQPVDDANRAGNTKACIDYCLSHPRWRLSAQLHKYLGIR